jgi:hypothetical protein
MKEIPCLLWNQKVLLLYLHELVTGQYHQTTQFITYLDVKFISDPFQYYPPICAYIMPHLEYSELCLLLAYLLFWFLRPWTCKQPMSSSLCLLHSYMCIKERKMSLCLISGVLCHEGKWGSGDLAPLFLTLALDGRWVVKFTPRPFYPRGNRPPLDPLERRLGELTTTGLDAPEKRNLTPVGESNPGFPSYSPCLYRLSYPDSHCTCV